MKKINRFSILSFFLVGAYLLSACGATLAPSTAVQAQKVEAHEVVFTGVVEAINGSQWTVSGQQVTVDTQTALDPNIAVGDIVKVEANVSAEGAVTAFKVEASVSEDTADNSNTASDNAAADNTNTDAGNANDNSAIDNSNSPNDNAANDNGSNGNSADPANEVFGVVEAITTESIIVDGVTYNFASFTEIKDAIVVGDQVKIHVIVNADGTFTIREIEQSLGQGVDDNTNGNDDTNDDSSNSNSDDDNGNGSNGNDDDDDKDEDNSNGDHDNDNGSNSNDD